MNNKKFIPPKSWVYDEEIIVGKTHPAYCQSTREEIENKEGKGTRRLTEKEIMLFDLGIFD